MAARFSLSHSTAMESNSMLSTTTIDATPEHRMSPFLHRPHLFLFLEDGDFLNEIGGVWDLAVCHSPFRVRVMVQETRGTMRGDQERVKGGLSESALALNSPGGERAAMRSGADLGADELRPRPYFTLSKEG